MSTEQRLVKVAAYASAVADSYLSARQKLAILEPLVGEEIAKTAEQLVWRTFIGSWR